MKRVLKYFVSTIVIMLLFATAIVLETKNGWFYSAIAEKTETQNFVNEVKNVLKTEFAGNFAMAVISNGVVEKEVFNSFGKKVDRTSIFQVASLSKWVSAVGVMKLVEQGKLDLDEPISSYLTRWNLPESEFDHQKVTVRRLLSHTAGLTDGLGYSGFNSRKEVQSLESSLTKALDADEGLSGVVKVGMEPGTAFKYSGGGYTVLQLLVEEVSGKTFAEFMKEEIFEPLKMNHSTYVLADSSEKDLVEFYNADSTKAQHYYYTSLAATSLYTTLADLEIFFQVFLPGKNGEPIGRNVIEAKTLKKMREPHASTMGMDIWGLGTILYASTENGDSIIGHDGKSTPPINTAIRLDPETGNGVIILETGNTLLASKLASEWVFWKTGKVDLVLFTMLKDKMVSSILKVFMLVPILAILIGFFRRKKRVIKDVSN